MVKDNSNYSQEEWKEALVNSIVWAEMLVLGLPPNSKFVESLRKVAKQAWSMAESLSPSVIHGNVELFRPPPRKSGEAKQANLFNTELEGSAGRAGGEREAGAVGSGPQQQMGEGHGGSGGGRLLPGGEFTTGGIGEPEMKKRQVTTEDLASFLVGKVSQLNNDIAKTVDYFLESNNKYNKFRNNIIDEMQWLFLAGGIIALDIKYGKEIASSVISNVLDLYTIIHKHNDYNSPFDMNLLLSVQKRLEYYYDNYVSHINEIGNSNPSRKFDKDFHKYIYDCGINNLAISCIKLVTIDINVIDCQKLERFINVIMHELMTQYHKEIGLIVGKD
jgi:hypothetical protein